MATTTRNNTNDRIYKRYVPSFKSQVTLDIRPVQTKYTTMQILDEYPKINTMLEQRSFYNVEKDFLPVSSGAPINTLLSNVDDESMLRNQFFAIQHCDKKEYVPSSNSDMYSVEVVGRREKDNHNLLFKEPSYASSIDGKHFKPKKLFNNSTSAKLNN